MKRKILFLLCIFAVVCLVQAQEDEKLIITVLDFTTEEVSKATMEIIVERLSSSLFQAGRYTVIDVEKRDTLLEEMKFTLTGLTDESAVVEVGKLLAAQGIVMGNLSKVGAKYVLSSKLLETETGKTLYTEDGTYRDLETMVEDMPRIAGLLSGTVEGKLIYIKDTPAYRKRVAGLSLLGSGAFLAGTGGFFLVNGGLMLKKTADALERYDSLDSGNTAAEFDSAYDDYLQAYNRASENHAGLQVIAGSAGSATGLIAAGLGTYFLSAAVNEVESNKSTVRYDFGITVLPLTTGTRLTFRISY